MATSRSADWRTALRPTNAEWSHGWRQDIVYTARALKRSYGITFTIVLTLALGLGTNAAIFSFLDQVFLRAPAGVASPGQIRRLWMQQPAGASRVPIITHSLAYHEYRAVASAVSDQAQLALYTTQTNVPVGRGDASATATVSYATASYFSALGVRLVIGRSFTDPEADVHTASRVVVVSDAFWRRQLGADASAIGKTLTVDARDYTIIGIAPPHFSGIDLQEVELWLPLGAFPTRDVPRVSFWDSSVIFFSVFGRMTPGANERVVEQRASNAYRHAPVTDFTPSPSAEIFFRSIIDARGLGAQPREVSIGVRLSIVAIIVLLITAANVINLLLARSTARRREIAVRLALGISRARLMRLFIMESALLSLAAGAAALLSAQVTGGLLRSLLLPGTHFAEGSLRWAVVVFTISLSLVTGVVAGVVPAVQGSKPDLTLSLKAHTRDGASGRSLLPTMLVGAQAALSVVLLVGAALLVSSARNVQQLRIGFDVPRLAYASVALPYGERSDTAAFAATMRAVGDRLRGAPGVEAVAFAREEPMTWFGRITFYTATDSSESPGRPLPTASYVSADFFKAIGVSFSRGAPFSDRDERSATAVVVNRTLARTYWPDRDPIGQCIRIQRRDSPCLTVVGVVDDAVRQQLIEEPAPQIYLPIFRSVRGQRPPNAMVIRADPERLALVMMRASSALRDAFPRGEPRVVRMADRLAPQFRPWRLGATLFSAFGILALVVAALGIYSSVSYSVTQRVHELGVRIALGAAMGDVMRHVVGRGVRPPVAGAVVGAALAVSSGRLISSLLYGIAPWNPVIMVAVVSMLITVAVIASCIPGWRAARIDPVRALAAD